MLKEFAEFAKKEIAEGGPEPELAPIVHLVRNRTDVDKVWAAGVYCSHHCVPSAMALLQAFPTPEEALEQEGKILEGFLADNWDYLPVRNEMRSHRMIEKRLQCLLDFADYSLRGIWHPNKSTSYAEVWTDSIGSVKYFGRYVAVKYLEFLRRMVNPALVCPDIRAKHGWSPRAALAAIYPETEPWMSNRYLNDDLTISKVEFYADKLISDLIEQHQLTISHFDAQVLLCEFKQFTHGTFYPGVSHDEEMDFGLIVEQRFNIPEFWEIRKELFPASALGEIGGWVGKRKDKYKK